MQVTPWLLDAMLRSDTFAAESAFVSGPPANLFKNSVLENKKDDQT